MSELPTVTLDDTSTETVIGPLAQRVAQRLCTLAHEDDPDVLLAAQLAVAAPGGGHVCVDLAELSGEVTLVADASDLGLVGLDDEVPAAADVTRALPSDTGAWLTALLGSAVARPSDDPARSAPLVVDGTRLYLDRYWGYEDRLRTQLLDRATATVDVDRVQLRAALDAHAAPLAADGTGPVTDRQRLAVATALLRRLAVISGGPGTGKTHTVVSVLAAVVELAHRTDAPVPRIALAAPTGKAAARLEEAIREAVARRGFPPYVDTALQGLHAATLHRLLGHQRRSPTRFRHDADTPLPYDLVIVDEASMVPLSLVAKLVDAVAPSARLVLVGDRNQLASVEAGAVLGDICGPPPRGSSLRLSAGWAAELTEVTGEPVAEEAELRERAGPWDTIVQLERFFRFGPDTGIGAVARAIQAIDDDAGGVLELLTGDAVEEGAPVDRYDDVALVVPTRPALPEQLRETVVGALGPYLDAALAGDAATALARLDDVRLLCATRSGPLGVDRVGEQVETWVRETDDRLGGPVNGWYAGLPVMVTRNDHDLGVMNGDVGVTVQRGDRLVVAFPTTSGEVREVPTVRVVDREPVWAMTIHKSQGSQFRHAIVVLPDRVNRVVSRELVYTGVTRAEQRVTVVSSPAVLSAALRRPVRRATGLRERLWPDG